MGGRGLHARGERARVARRVRGLLDAHHPDGAAAGLVDERWLPGVDFDAPVPRRTEGGDARDQAAVGDAAPSPSAWLRRLRFDPGLRGAAGLGCAALIAALVVGWWVLASRAHSVPIAASAPPSPLVASSPALSAPASASGSPGAVVSAGAGGSAGSASGSAPVDLNTASLEQLDGLPGVGPVLAQRIVDWRTAHGRFASVDQLREVSGIGPSKFDDIRGLVTV